MKCKKSKQLSDISIQDLVLFLNSSETFSVSHLRLLLSLKDLVNNELLQSVLAVDKGTGATSKELWQLKLQLQTLSGRQVNTLPKGDIQL